MIYPNPIQKVPEDPPENQSQSYLAGEAVRLEVVSLPYQGE